MSSGLQRSWHEIEVTQNNVVVEVKPEPGLWEEEMDSQGRQDVGGGKDM